VLQVHPTRRCNLTCLHCYSQSGPTERAELPIEVLRVLLAEAAAEGFDTLGISGGEPLLYSQLAALLRAGREEGMVTTVTTNGMLLTRPLLARIGEHLQLLAISLDGTPASHARMRGSPKAFSAMEGNLELVRAARVPFGFIFTLTQFNLDELEWVAQFALTQGATLLQIHPLEEVGRARMTLSGAAPDAQEESHAFVEALKLQAQLGERLHVQVDLVPLAVARSQPELLFAEDDPPPPASRLSDLVCPLVVETDGTLSPLQYGFGREFALGNLLEHSLADLASAWRANGYGRFRKLCREVLRRRLAAGGWPMMNWYEVVARASLQAAIAR
jgi:MoaA/NifB/PqqE/SkfB family radical SAM enzyme